MKDILDSIIEELEELDTFEEVLDMAISLEEKGRSFYLDKLAEIKSPTVQDIFTYLAREEKKHSQYLRDFKEKYSKDSISHDLSSFNPGAATTPDFREMLQEEFSERWSDEEGVLLSALRFEKKTEMLYTELARRATDKKKKHFFEKLANYEKEHYELIDGFLEFSTQFRMET
ncbi:ferritin-like domain-containing protein [Methanosalsum natronophilum]|nr:ferritin family protein [Methanosalsum natronophilum]MCS3923467.1 rubrerythrin [Methanosalsum natronophilum]